MIKRLLDIALALLGFVVVFPLFVVVGVLIKVDSEGAVFYRGVRTGRCGNPFRIFKFRTMVVNAERIGGTSTAETDPRITRLGRFLRKHKIDELPQLINVLKGEMSLVGPRPEVEEYTRLYNHEEMEILSVPPGITDFSSIRFRELNAILAKASDPDRYFATHILPEKNRLRLEYVRNRSLWLDLRIIFQTLRGLWIK